jgi:UDP-2-acetamido-2,6-beta-L-arabino-hexul-4-ose reductase
MKILVTGAKGFVGKNLVVELKNRGYNDIYEFNRESNHSLLEQYTQECDFVFHLAGVNRPKQEKEFMEVNAGLTSQLLGLLKEHNNHCPVLITSSIQAEKDNLYGRSKKAGEDLLFSYSEETSAKPLVYRLPNLFGKWSKPDYNSVVATFCHNITHELPIQVNDPNVKMKLVYIDDILNEFISALKGAENRKENFCYVEPVYEIKLGKIVDLINSFKNSRNDLCIADMSDSFTKKLYSTYLSYLPTDQFSYPLKVNMDGRGSFTEFIKTADRGQVSINISKPKITKGNHWHHTKNEKFLVVSGKGVIRFRKIDSDEVVEYFVSGDELEVVDIPTGYTHNIENLGDRDMITIMWANELFDPEKPDTYRLEVKL